VISDVLNLYTLNHQKFPAKVGNVCYYGYQTDGDNYGKQVGVDILQLRKGYDENEYSYWN